ncbi:MAG: hypothetical protein H0U44_05625 [Flavisolibacter sp.]|jgi:hypothetical protein|nr:hypothetical protein [Flavisolibacter sp.]
MNFRKAFLSDFRLLQFTTLGQVGAMLFFLTIVFFYNLNRVAFLDGQASQFFFLPASVALTIIAIRVSRYIYRRRMEYIFVDTVTERQRLEQFKSTLFLHHAICLVPAITSTICFLLFANFFYVILNGFIIAELSAKYSSDRIISNAINVLNFKM